MVSARSEYRYAAPTRERDENATDGSATPDHVYWRRKVRELLSMLVFVISVFGMTIAITRRCQLVDERMQQSGREDKATLSTNTEIDLLCSVAKHLVSRYYNKVTAEWDADAIVAAREAVVEMFDVYATCLVRLSPAECSFLLEECIVCKADD